MNSSDLAPVLVVGLISLVAGAVAIFRGPIGKAIGRRLEGSTGVPPELEARLQDLESRMAAAEEERSELLGRLEFAERMLLQSREGPKELGR